MPIFSFHDLEYFIIVRWGPMIAFIALSIAGALIYEKRHKQE